MAKGGTTFTNVRSLTVVNGFNVCFQAALLGKPPAAVTFLAYKRFFAEMNGADVTVQVRLLAKEATAARLCAFKVPLAAMDELDVLDEIAVLLECSATLVACIRLFVGRSAGFDVLIERSGA